MDTNTSKKKLQLSEAKKFNELTTDILRLKEKAKNFVIGLLSDRGVESVNVAAYFEKMDEDPELDVYAYIYDVREIGYGTCLKLASIGLSDGQFLFRLWNEDDSPVGDYTINDFTGEELYHIGSALMSLFEYADRCCDGEVIPEE